jgi:DNA mismatch endonuclease, patch repair protein
MAADSLTPQQRSDHMKHIRSKNTVPELTVRRIVYGLGFRYRLHVSGLPGKPDIVLRKLRKVIFVHGCFWHQHVECRDGRLPTSRQEYWKPKLERNMTRDAEHIASLHSRGWEVLVVWECRTKAHAALKDEIELFLSRQ